MRILPFLLATSLHAAQPSDAPSVNADAILRELDSIEKKQSELLDRSKTAAFAKLRSAAASGPAAAALYGDAIEAVRFEGLRGKVAENLEWKKQNADMLRSSEFQGAAQLHLRYLALAINRGAAEDPAKDAQASLDYAADLAKFLLDSQREGQLPEQARGLLDKPASESVVSKWLRLAPWLPPADAWEPAAGKLGGILEKNVRKPWREAGEPKLIQTYDLELQFEAERVTATHLTHEAEVYNSVQRPRVQFARATDLAGLGMKNHAANEVLALIRAYPQHPDFSSWAAMLRQLLSAGPPAQP